MPVTPPVGLEETRPASVKYIAGAVIALALIFLGWTLFSMVRSQNAAADHFEKTAVPKSRPGTDAAVMPGGYGEMMKERAMQNLRQNGVPAGMPAR